LHRRDTGLLTGGEEHPVKPPPTQCLTRRRGASPATEHRLQVATATSRGVTGHARLVRFVRCETAGLHRESIHNRPPFSSRPMERT
jgi:hypothetical protein